MAKRPNPRKIKKYRTYRVQEAADSLGVSVPTVRAWIKAGLPVMRTTRPFLIFGPDLRAFLEDRVRSRKTKLQPGQVFCLSCKKARFPAGMIADYIPKNEGSGTLVGLCPQCNTVCNRFLRGADLPLLKGILDIATRRGG